MERVQLHKIGIIFSLFTLIALFSLKDGFCQENIKYKIPFSKIAPIKTTTLSGASNNIRVKLPIPERWQINKATLNFSYVNSTALLQNRSRLVVWLNDNPIAQINLNPQLPQGKVSVNLPVNLLKSGYNDLNFTVAHHYTIECEDPSAPELWTTIEFDQASFDFDISLRKVPENLSAIANFLFDPKLPAENTVNIVISDKSEEMIELASIVASSVALRFEYRPVKFTISELPKKGVDNIVIGNNEFVKSLIGDLLDNGGIIRIKTLADDPYHALLIIKGDTKDELKKAAYAFASINFPFPKTQTIRVEEVNLKPQAPKAGKGILFPGYEYSFKELGFFTNTFKGVGAKSFSMDFKLPSYVFLKPNSFISLKLNFSYGSGMRKDSTLNIQVNGKYVASVHLENIKGGLIRDYILDIPMNLFKPGYNVITFTAVLSPLITGYCEFVQTENLQLTIFEDSKISIPQTPAWTEMPDISLFFLDGFPFSNPADFSKAGVLITEQNIDTITSAINLIALSSQRAGYVPFKIRVSSDISKIKDRNIIAVGEITKIPEDYLKAGQIKVQEKGSFVYYLVRNFEKSESVINAKLRSFIGNIIPIFKAKTDFQYSKSIMNYSGKNEGRWFVLSEFESPYKERNTVLVVTASEKESLLAGTYALLESAVFSKAAGALTVFDINASENTIHSYYTDKTYYVGKMGIFPALNAWIYAHPLIFTSLMLILILLLAYLIYKTIKAFRVKRISEIDK